MSNVFAKSTVDDLIRVIQELSMARELATVQEVVRRAARRLTGADGATFVLRDGSMCFYADEDAIAPLWKGKRFPMEVCISGWVMLNRQGAVIPDIYADSRIPHDAYRPTFVHSLVVVPIRTLDPIGAIGAYWATEHQASPDEVGILQALADTTAVALESVRLEERVRCRTQELEDANRMLAAEVAERERAEEQVRILSITDELTGLYNRRGFLLLATAAQAGLARDAPGGQVVFVDVDGLKPVNDTLGHEHGDVMLRAAADVLRACFRDGDIVARIGGDEFAVFVLSTLDDGASVTSRIQAAVARRNSEDGLPALLQLSVGVTSVRPVAPEPLEVLLARADARMYHEKRDKRCQPRRPAV